METKRANESIEIFKHQRLSKAGYAFVPNDSSWSLSKDVILNLGNLKEVLEPKTASGFINTLIYYAENLSANHTQNILGRFKHMIRVSNSPLINTSSLINYRSGLSDQHQWYLGTIRGFLKKWNELGHIGVESDVIDLLNGWALKGNEKGDLIKRLDPKNGPLTDIELLAFNERATQAFEQDKIRLSDLALALCISNTGRRAIQISHLKVKDVLQGKNRQGEPTYLLNIPRAKQRGAEFRGQFKQFAITRDLWVILTSHAQDVIFKVKNILTFLLPETDQLALPLFPNFQDFEDIPTLKELQHLSAMGHIHTKANKISETLKRIGTVAEIYSERTGEPLQLSSSRFRYTIGTRAAREGFGEMVIAELLDHSDTQNAGVYIQNIPEHVQKLDQAIGLYLAPYAQAFAGVLVDSAKQAIRGDDPRSQIRNEAQGIGTCGLHGFCGANAPIPCYTCIHFQPWLDGPHERVYQGLINERERLLDITGDIVIAAINDRTIIAVADVIQRCDKRKKEIAYG